MISKRVEKFILPWLVAHQLLIFGVWVPLTKGCKPYDMNLEVLNLEDRRVII